MINKMRHFWVQKVLPLVYDASLSYYELLCKLLDKINEVIESLTVVEQTVSDHEERITDLEERVTNCEEAIDGLDMRMDDAEGRLDNLEECCAEKGAEIDDLQTRMNDSESRITNLETCCEQVNDKIGLFPSTLGEPGQILIVNEDGTSAEWSENTTIDDGTITSENSDGEKVEIDPSEGMSFYDNSDNRTAIYTSNAIEFLQANDIGVYNAEGCGFEPFDTVGSHSIPMQTDRIYLVTFVDRAAYNTDANDGMWLVYTNDGLYNGRSKIITLKASAAATLSIDVLTLTITRTCQYGKMTWTRLG